MKTFCFTLDDNVRFFKELTQNEEKSLVDQPYTSMLLRLHKQFDVKIQLNVFFECEGFTLSQMTDRYKNEWLENSSWLKLSFHSRQETDFPYRAAGYNEIFADCRAVKSEIVRFAGDKTAADTTTIHFCQVTPEGLMALEDNGIKGLLGLFGDEKNNETSYSIGKADAGRIRRGELVAVGGIVYSGIDVIMNLFEMDGIINRLNALSYREHVNVMIHEQYFYHDYPAYQPDFEAKLATALGYLREHGYESVFLEEKIL